MKKKDSQNLIGVILIAAVLIIIFVGGYFFANYQPVILDQNTGCVKDSGPEKYYVIIVDNTESLTAIQKSDVKNKIYKIIDSVLPNDKVIIYSLNDSPLNNIKPLIEKCSLRDGRDYNKWTENKKLLKKRKSELFDAPITKALNDMMVIEKAAQFSPIIELIQKIRINDLPDSETGKTMQIHLFSDLLQNSKNFSFYDPSYKIDQFLKSNNFNRISSDLSGIDVFIWQLNNSLINPSDLVYFWEEVLRKMNSDISGLNRISG